MKRAVSISIGSSKRDKLVEFTLFGEKIRLERIGTDGDMEKAARLFQDLDGKVDAFGVGGAVLGLLVDNHWYPLRSVQPMVRFAHKTPVVDGTGLKATLECMAATVVDQELKGYMPERKAFLMSGVDRYGLTSSFLDAGYESIIGDLMFVLGLPIPVRTKKNLKRLLVLLLPIVGRLPFSWLYPVGESQEERTPKYTRYFDWATLIAGDCHYITRYMPDKIIDKVVVTNTTTTGDRSLFKNAGVRFLITTTPVLDGRSFGTNMMEAALIASIGRKEPVDYANPGNYFNEMNRLVNELNMRPQIQEL